MLNGILVEGVDCYQTWRTKLLILANMVKAVVNNDMAEMVVV